MQTTARTIPTTLISRIVRGRAALDMLLVIGASAVIAIAAQIAIPMPGTLVPLTLQPLAVLLVGVTLGSRGAAAAALYLLEGFSGLPVFAQVTADRSGCRTHCRLPLLPSVRRTSCRLVLTARLGLDDATRRRRYAGRPRRDLPRRLVVARPRSAVQSSVDRRRAAVHPADIVKVARSLAAAAIAAPDRRSPYWHPAGRYE